MAISDNLRGALYMSIAMAAFTLNDSAMKAVTEHIPLYQAIALRGLLTLGPLLVIAHIRGGLRFQMARRDGMAIGIRSAAEVGGTLLFLATLMHMPLANLSAILQSLPLAVSLTAWAVFGDRIGWRRLTAIAVGFAGVLIIIRPGPDGFDHWSLMGLASVACVVVRDLSTRELSRNVPSATVAVFASGSVTIVGLALSMTTEWQALNAHQWLLVAAASSALVVGYMFVVMVMRVGDIGFVAPFRYTALLWAIFLGWIAFGTLPDLLTLLGAGLVVGSGIFTLWRERRLKVSVPVARRA
jgi:drug/metabolite transporter (DMT)-like permease